MGKGEAPASTDLSPSLTNSKESEGQCNSEGIMLARKAGVLGGGGEG